MFWELSKSSVAGSLIAVIVLVCLQVLRLSDVIVKFDLERSLVLRMLLGLAVSFMPLVVPIAVLFALLGVYGRMSTDREFVAAQSMGFSPARLLRSGMAFGVLAVAASLWFSFSLGPAGNRNFEATLDEAFKRKVASALGSGTFTEGFLDMVLFVDRIDPVTQELDRVFLNDATNFREEVSISARKGRWIQPTEEHSLGTLKLVDGVVVSREVERDTVRRVKFDEYRIYADFSSKAGVSRDSPQSQDWGGLMKKRAALTPGADLRPVWVEIARRFGVSFACLLFVPLSFALGFDNRRTAKGRAAMTGLIVLFAYWTLYFALMTWLLGAKIDFVRGSEWFTWLVIWLPNLALACVGGWIFNHKRSGMVA